MKKTMLSLGVVSMAVSSSLWAEQLGTIAVESTKLTDVSGEQVKSADLAEALAKNVPSVSIVRRSGIANDIILRGQKKDNINILIDNTKVYGACPNRMDPPTSHILTNNIAGIEIIEGPYDVENFGTLSGAVKIETRKPSQDFQGEVSVNMGSWDYRKAATTMSGGSDSARFLVSLSRETSGQYEDGDGKDFYEQIAGLNLPAPVGVQYKDIYRNLDAYEKKTFLGKAYVDVTDNQELRFSYTANRSDDVLYPSSKMDALYDDSDIFNLEYSIRELGRFSKQLDIQLYTSEVEHPMSTFYRNSSGPGSVNEKISMLTTDMRGLKIKDSFDLSDSTQLTIGLDASNRNWDGRYIGEGTQAMITGVKSIDDVDTENAALFAEMEKRDDKLTLKAGARYDDTSIKPAASSGLAENDYSSISANVFSSYQASEHTRYFAGVGKASRVPDARELYFRSAMVSGMMLMIPLKGTPTLQDTSNYQIDLGVENNYDSWLLKTKLFHSWLKDYIYYNADASMNSFENIDATIYGVEFSGSWFASDEVYVDFGLAYLRGRKDEALAGQSDKDLAEIPPLKMNLAVNYDYAYKSTASIALVAADAWDNFDADNGEQALKGYGVVNMKVKHELNRQFEITAGIDNVFDKTYAVSNTYEDLTLLFDGSGEVMLLNEPGRYYYVNVAYRF
jgi:iron complex outermembrane receptor protein